MDVLIKQEKFHRIIFKKYKIKKIVKEEQTLRNLLCYYHELACNKYENDSIFTKVLGYFYDAKFKVKLSTFGIYSVLEYSLACVDPKFINDSMYNTKALEELFLDCCQAKIINENFDENIFNRAYELYESDLLMREDSHQSEALKGLIKTYFKDTMRDFDSFGSLEDLVDITCLDLYNYYLTTLEEETISMVSSLEDLYVNNQSTLQPKTNYHFKERNNVDKMVVVDSASKQCYLEIIYETKTFADDKLYYPMMFLNYLFGGKSSSYLFNIVREKYGLCYSVSSMYLAASGIIVVSIILNKKDVNQAIDAVKEALLKIKEDDFDIEEIRKYYLSVYLIGEDNQETQIANYLTDNYFIDSPKSTSEYDEIIKVKKEDILEALDLLEESFIYVYGGEYFE